MSARPKQKGLLLWRRTKKHPAGTATSEKRITGGLKLHRSLTIRNPAGEVIDYKDTSRRVLGSTAITPGFL